MAQAPNFDRSANYFRNKGGWIQVIYPDRSAETQADEKRAAEERHYSRGTFHGNWDWHPDSHGMRS